MSWTTLRGHRPTGPVFHDIHDNQQIPRQKCSCGSRYCVEHIMKVADGSGGVDEPEDSLF
jgi:hypothetical protein